MTDMKKQYAREEIHMTNIQKRAAQYMGSGKALHLRILLRSRFWFGGAGVRPQF